MNPVIDRFITLEGLASLPTHICSHVMKHAEFLPKADAVRIAADGAYFMNHSDDPNLLDSGDEMFAIRDILPGEELLCDYRQTLVLAFDPDTGSRRLEFDPTNNCKNR